MKAMERKYRLFVGNPGVGKSTMVNCLAQRVLFRSGVSFGQGLTFKLDKASHDGITYIDTPGLSDVKLRKQAAEAITEALKQNGIYQIFFVVTLESGRVRPDDLATIKLVLESAKDITTFNLIVNKLSKNLFEGIQNVDAAKVLLADLNFSVGDDVDPPKVLLLQRDNDLEDTNDSFSHMEELVEFVNEATYVRINASAVRDIPADNSFDKLAAMLQEQLSDIRKDNELMRQHLQRTEERYSQLLKDNRDLQDRLQRAEGNASSSTTKKDSSYCSVM